MKPPARRDGLLIRELGDETLVYDRERHEAHCLNRTAGLVFRHCAGNRTVEEIAILLSGGADAAAGEALVRLALEQLSSANLLVAGEQQVVAGEEHYIAGEKHATSQREREAGGTSRRELLRLGALAAPVIASIVAPTPAQAASGCVPESGCSNSTNWCKPCDRGAGCGAGDYCDPSFGCAAGLPGGC